MTAIWDDLPCILLEQILQDKAWASAAPGAAGDGYAVRKAGPR